MQKLSVANNTKQKLALFLDKIAQPLQRRGFGFSPVGEAAPTKLVY
jgi:hypothetical protein